MADQKVELTVKVNSDTGGIDVVSSKLKGLSETAKSTESSFLGLSGTSADLVKQFLPFVTVVGGATFAISKLTSFISDSIKESEDYRQTLLRMQSALITTGGSWDKSGKAIEDWAQAIQKSTRFSDNQALTALDRLTRATGNLTIAQKTASLAMDISVKSGRNFNDTTDLLTRLILGQNRALLESQKEFGKLLENAKDNKEAITALAHAYEGAAIAEKSLTSESNKLTHEWEDLKKNVGNALTPILLTLTETMNNLFPTMSKVGILLKSYFTKGALGMALSFKELREDFKAVDQEAKAMEQSINNLKAGSGGLGDALANFKAPKIGGPTKEELAKKEKERLDAKAEIDGQIAQLEDQLNIKMQQLGDDSLLKKRAIMQAEEQAEINKVTRMAKGDEDTERKKQVAIDKIKGLYRKRDQEQVKLDNKMKAELALDAASTAISALQMINNAGEINSRNDARRAKLLLALQQAITIANIWASNTKLGPWGVAKSIAETGLAVAAFAVQSKAIDKARSVNNQEMTSSSISQDLGNGDTITDTFSTGTNTSGGVSSGSTTTGGSSSSGGGGGGTIINVGGVVVNFSTDSVDLSSVGQVARQLGEAVQRKTTEAVQMAIAIYNSGQQNSGVAR